MLPALTLASFFIPAIKLSAYQVLQGLKNCSCVALHLSRSMRTDVIPIPKVWIEKKIEESKFARDNIGGFPMQSHLLEALNVSRKQIVLSSGHQTLPAILPI